MHERESVAVAEYIPYKDFWEKIRIVKENLMQGKHVEIWQDGVYVYGEEIGQHGAEQKRKA